MSQINVLLQKGWVMKPEKRCWRYTTKTLYYVCFKPASNDTPVLLPLLVYCCCCCSYRSQFIVTASIMYKVHELATKSTNLKKCTNRSQPSTRTIVTSIVLIWLLLLVLGGTSTRGPCVRGVSEHVQLLRMFVA